MPPSQPAAGLVWSINRPEATLLLNGSTSRGPAVCLWLQRQNEHHGCALHQTQAQSQAHPSLAECTALLDAHTRPFHNNKNVVGVPQASQQLHVDLMLILCSAYAGVAKPCTCLPGRDCSGRLAAAVGFACGGCTYDARGAMVRSCLEGMEPQPRASCRRSTSHMLPQP